MNIPPHLAAMMANLGITPEMLAQQAQKTISPPVIDYSLPVEEIQRRMTQFQAWVDREQMLGTTKASRVDRRSLIAAQEQARRDSTTSGEHLMRSTFVGFDKHSSTTPISQLSRISISQLLVRRVHIGHYLLCRVMGPCVRFVALSIPIEDPEGWVHSLSVYNFPTAECASPADVDALFPLGTILAIREPTFKMGTQSSQPILRVDSPSDIVRVDIGSDVLINIDWKTGAVVRGAPPLPTSAEEWKKLGNTHFKGGHWFAAATAYSEGLVVEPGAHLLRLNRAEAYLRLGYFSAALADAEYVLPLLDAADGSRQKALFRAANGAYGCQDYASAADRFLEFLREDPKNSEASKGLKRVQLRLREVRQGQYDWVQLFKDSKRSSKVDAADYVGPIKVSVIRHRGGGRGVIATKTIKAGELLVVSKPFVSVFPEEIPKNETVMCMNLLRKSMNNHAQYLLICRVMSKIYGNPELYEAVNSLYAGPTHAPPPSLYSPAPHNRLPLSHPGIPAVDIDAARIEGIISFNGFSPYSTSHVPSEQNAMEIEGEVTSGSGEQDNGKASALYLLPSLFNHACLPNATWFCFGDLMVIRAREEIATGAEITLSYTAFSKPFDERTKNLERYIHGMKCLCTLCEADRSDGRQGLQRRAELFQLVRQIPVNQKGCLKQLRTMQREMEVTYKGPRLVRVEMFETQRTISNALDMRAGNDINSTFFTRAIDERIKALEALGLEVIDASTKGPILGDADDLPIGTTRLPSAAALQFPVREMLIVAHRFFEMNDSRRGDRWMKASIWVDDKVTGGGKRMLELRYCDFLAGGNYGPLLARIS